jgi:hypothetical protein
VGSLLCIRHSDNIVPYVEAGRTTRKAAGRLGRPSS